MTTTTRKALLWLVLLGLLASVPALAGVEKPVGVVVSCRGDVVVVRSTGETIKATFGLSLNAGDWVKAGEASEAEVLLEGGGWIKLGSNGKTQIMGSKRPAKPAAEPTTKPATEWQSFQVVQNFLKLKDSEGTSSLAGLRSADKQPELRAVSPSQTKVRDAHPTFRWYASDSSTKLRFKLYDDTGVLWQEDVAGITELKYPADAPALVPGKSYTWALETSDPLRFPPLRSQAAFFEVLTDDEVAQVATALGQIDAEVKPTESSYHVVRASVFFSHNLMEEAIQETQSAITIDPDNATLQSILARLYAQAGRSEEALNEYNQLLDKQ